MSFSMSLFAAQKLSLEMARGDDDVLYFSLRGVFAFTAITPPPSPRLRWSPEALRSK
jgi:hypothetical protein